MARAKANINYRTNKCLAVSRVIRQSLQNFIMNKRNSGGMFLAAWR